MTTSEQDRIAALERKLAHLDHVQGRVVRTIRELAEVVATLAVELRELRDDDKRDDYSGDDSH